MAKSPKNSPKTENVEAEAVETDTPITAADAVETPVASDEQPNVAAVLSAIEDLDELEKLYKARRSELKQTAKSENKVAAVDLVEAQAAADVAHLLFTVGQRGMKLNNFTIRYDGRKDDAEQIKCVTGAVRMTEDEKKAHAENYAELIAAQAEQAAIDAAMSPEGEEPAENDSDEA